MDSSTELLLYAETPFLSGAEKQILLNFGYLRKHNYEVQLLITTSRDGRSEFDSLDLGDHATFIESRLLGIQSNRRIRNFLYEQWSFIAGLARGLRTCSGKRLRTVHVSNGGHPGSAGARGFATAVALFHPRVQLVITVNNLAVPYNSFPRLLDLVSDRILASRALWVTGSEVARNQLMEVLGIPHGKVIVIPNGVQKPHCLCNGRQTSSLLRRQIGDRKVLLSVGHLVNRKGHEVLIEAIFLLRKSAQISEEWVLLIEGKGELSAHLEKRVRELNLGNQIFLLGRFGCIAELYDLCDVFVHPSIANEDLPNVISEAMSYSLPVIATDVGGASEQVEAGVTGTVIEPGSPSQLAEALIALMEKPSLRKKLGNRGRVAYLQKFSPTVAFNKYLDEYRR